MGIKWHFWVSFSNSAHFLWFCILEHHFSLGVRGYNEWGKFKGIKRINETHRFKGCHAKRSGYFWLTHSAKCSSIWTHDLSCSITVGHPLLMSTMLMSFRWKKANHPKGYFDSNYWEWIQFNSIQLIFSKPQTQLLSYHIWNTSGNVITLNLWVKRFCALFFLSCFCFSTSPSFSFSLHF